LSCWLVSAGGNRVQGAKPFQPPDPRAELETLAKELRTGRAEERRAAVKRLAELGGEPAWDLVLTCLADPESAVADQAELKLARVPSERLWRDLLARSGLESKEPRVRWRAAELVGRAERAIDSDLLFRAFEPRDAELTRRLCASVERLAQRQKLTGKPELLAQRLRALSSSAAKDDLPLQGPGRLPWTAAEGVTFLAQ
jgi:hypothetical protein